MHVICTNINSLQPAWKTAFFSLTAKENNNEGDN